MEKNVLEYPFNVDFILKKKRSIKKDLLNRDVKYLEKNIAVLGGSTTRLFIEIMELFLLNYGIKPTFYESEYNMYYEDGAFPNSALVRFKPDIVYIHTSNRNIYDYPLISDNKEQVEEKIESVFEKFKGLWSNIFQAYNCPIIQNNFEMPFYRILGNSEASDYRGTVSFIRRLNYKFADYIDNTDNIFIHDIAYEQADYGLAKWSDPFYWHMYKYCMAVSAIPMSAYSVANIIKSIFGKNKKVLDLDCDNTLWGGVIGDDGVDNIEVGQETPMAQVYSEIQSYIKKQKDIGVLLAINSKNDETVAKGGFERPDSILKMDDFASFKANWNPKNLNIVESANELNLGIDSFVFMDDNPAEREIVRQNNGGVGVLDIDATTPERYILDLDRAGYFEVTNLSEDDLKRNEMYKANSERKKAEISFANYGEYLKSLQMKAEIQSFIPVYMNRIAQLTNKSNQFNLTTKRYSQTEIEVASTDESKITLYGKLQDKFGDNGVVSVIIGTIKNWELHIDLWIMSCRVLKRDMEFAMMDKLVEKCQQSRIDTVYGYYYPTEKNNMVKDFYAVQEFECISLDNEGNSVWKYEIPERYEHRNRYIDIV